jgi:hypothetical protein
MKMRPPSSGGARIEANPRPKTKRKEKLLKAHIIAQNFDKILKL